MKLVIGHLYYDLMNLYGENGNIKVLEYHLKNQGINVEVKKLSLDDKIDFSGIDLIYIGCGTERNRDIVLKDLLKYKKEIKNCFNENKFFLITGNALSLFGKYIEDLDNNKTKTLNIFDLHTKCEQTRTVKEVNTNCTFLKDNLLGFINTSDNIYDKNNKLIEYGIYKNNFYGTYLLGPILARNPEFMEYFITNLVLFKDNKFKLKPFNKELDEEAYLDYIAFKNS